MKKVIVTNPVYYALSLSAAKEHLRVDHTADDAYISTLIGVATLKAESYLLRKLITQTWQYFLDYWPHENYITIPFGQLNSITHIKYTDIDGTTNTDFDENDEWTVDTDSDPGRAVLKYGETYPTATLATNNPIEIQFVCGYGAHTPKIITAATNATPIVVTIVGHGYVTGNEVYISGGTTQTSINGLWRITKVNDNSFSLTGSSGNGVYDASSATCNLVDVPPSIIHAMQLVISDLYMQRETILINMMPHKLKTVEDLLYPYRLWEF